MKNKGYDIQRLSNALNVSRVAVERDLKRDELTRRTLAKYLGVLFDSLDEFYAESQAQAIVQNQNATVSYDLYSELQAKYIELQARFIELQSEHLQLTKRFFPKAVQPVSVTA